MKKHIQFLNQKHTEICNKHQSFLWSSRLIRLGIIGFILFILVVLGYGFYKSNSNQYSGDLTGVSVPKVKEIPLDFVHKYDAENKLPALGSAILDINNDGIKEVFIGGGPNQPDGFFAYENGAFVDISENSGLTKDPEQATYGAAVIDATQDGFVDMFVSRDDGVYLYTNQGDKTFVKTKTNIELNHKSSPMSLALTDLNNDGWVDIFVSAYIKKEFVEGYTIFNDKTYGASSILVLNNGDNTFTDITESAGLSYLHNTFVGVFVDADDDLDADLIVAYDTGQVRTYENNGDLTFTNTDNPTSDVFAYPMGLAVGDINNDEKVDFFFSNIGNTVPGFLAKGDLRDDQVLQPDWLLFENQGDFEFKDTAKEKDIANFEFSWGAVMTDLNLDGLEDLVVTESYIDFPFHKWFKLPGRVLLQKPNGKFVAAESAMGAVNKAFGIAPLIGDIDNDGDEDILHVNLDGKTLACLNENDNGNNFVKVVLPETPKSLGAKITLELENGQRYVKHFVSGEGLASDQSHDLIFGLGTEKDLKDIVITYLNGEVETINEVEANSTVKVQ